LRAPALSGHWGTGKTYLVHEFVRTQADTLNPVSRSELGGGSCAIGCSDDHCGKEHLPGSWQKCPSECRLVPREISGFDIPSVQRHRNPRSGGTPRSMPSWIGSLRRIRI